jgi:preprotein translocase subunit SecA
MSALIRHQVATTIFRVAIVRNTPPPEGTEGRAAPNAADGPPPADAEAGRRIARGMSNLRKPLPQGHPSGGSTGAPSGGAVRPGYSPSGTRMGRNDTCWCGSGKKYKKCHGQ